MGRLHLLLFRHAHAERDAASGRDEDRELTGRGRRDARRVGRFLTAVDLVPDAILTSPAARARATAEPALEAGGWGSTLRELSSLYGSTVDGAIDVLRRNGRNHRTLLLVGHEPTLSELTAALAGGGSVRLAKAAVAQLAFDLDDWTRLRPGTGVLRALITPSLLIGATSTAGGDAE